MSRMHAGLAFVGIGFLSSSAVLANPGFYFGVETGRSHFSVVAGDLKPGSFAPTSLYVPPFAAAPAPTAPVLGYAFRAFYTGPVAGLAIPSAHNIDKDDGTYRFSVGYEFSDYVSAELSYFDLGSVSYDVPVPLFSFNPFVPVMPAVQSTDIEVSGLQFELIGSWPVTPRISMFATGGYSFTDADVETSLLQSQRSETLGDRNTTLGAGVSWQAHPSWNLRLKFRREFGIGGEAFADAPHADAITLGFTFAPKQDQ